MLRLNNVSKFYYSKGVIAVGFSKVNLEFNIGEFVAITGESGSGKSTLLNVISGLDTYEEGEMYIDENETSHYTEKDFEDFRRKYVSNIFQNFNLINSYTVYQNVELVLLLNGYKKSQIKQKVLDIIQKVGLHEFRRTKVSKLSGGQKQKVAIARALAKETPIIIADEPTGNLDSESAQSIISLLSEISKDKLVIVVTHNYEQVEPFVQRKIKMHDGRVLEDKIIKNNEKENKEETKNEEEVKSIEYKNIKVLNRFRLGFRNTFNIATKFLLLFVIFLFMTTAIISEYAIFKKQEHLGEQQKANFFFQDRSENRIVIKKQDKTNFSPDEYLALANLSNIDYIAENDLLLDNETSFSDNQNLYIYGNVKNINTFKEELSVGRMPQAENELVLIGYKSNYYIKTLSEELEKADLYIRDNYTGMPDTETKLKVVGIKYKDESSFNYSTTEIYASNNILDKLKFFINRQYSKVQILFLDKYYDSTNGYFNIIPNKNVPQGQTYLSNDFNYYSSTGNVLKKQIQINVSNIYYKDTKTLNVGKTYTKNNMKTLLGINEYDANVNSIFVNPEDYNYLYNKAPYQSSVFVKDMENIYDTANELKELGYETLIIKDTLIDEGVSQVMKILRTVITLVLVIALFFISYFIINIILKSRNSYFSILRMLGLNKKIAKQIIIVELLLIMNLAFGIFTGTIFLASEGIINIDFINTSAEYLKFTDYAILYVVLVGMSYLISLKYAKKLFKHSTIKTFQEEL